MCPNCYQTAWENSLPPLTHVLCFRCGSSNLSLRTVSLRTVLKTNLSMIPFSEYVGKQKKPLPQTEKQHRRRLILSLCESAFIMHRPPAWLEMNPKSYYTPVPKSLQANTIQASHVRASVECPPLADCAFKKLKTAKGTRDSTCLPPSKNGL